MEKEIKEVQNFINVLEGKKINISATSCIVERGNIIWDYQDNETKASLNLYAMDEDQLNELKSELADDVLNYLKEKYLNQEIKLLDLDSEITELIPNSNSIFEYNVQEMLRDSFCYQYQDDPSPSGFNFEFKVIEDNKNGLDILVEVVNIDAI